MKLSIIKQALIQAIDTMGHHEDDVESVVAEVVDGAEGGGWLRVEFTFTDGSSTTVI